MASTNPASGLKLLTKNRAALDLIFAGALWGFGFIATVWALKAFTPVETLIYRFIVASVFGEIIYLMARGPRYTTLKTEFLRAFPAGLFLGGMLLLQTIGLQYTTATKSGFLTSLYVVIVPVFNSWFLKEKTHWKNYLLVAMALIGTYILMGASLEGLNVGDLWTIACAFIAAAHIIYIGRVSPGIGNAFRFNNFQSIWCLFLLLPLLTTQTGFHWETNDLLPWIGILCLGVASSVVAFYLQIRSQRVLSDSTASMLFLLESPFAAIFGYLVLSERLSLFQTSGALMILVAATLQILWEPSAKTTQTKPE